MEHSKFAVKTYFIIIRYNVNSAKTYSKHFPGIISQYY